MRILIVGDTHGEITYINRYYRALKQSGCDFVGFEKGVFKFPCPVYVIHGNHEDTVADDYLSGKKQIPNMYVFPRYGEIVDVQVGDESITLFGVGGAKNAPGDLSWSYPFDEKIEFMKARELWIKRGSPKVDLLLTHEAPTGTGSIGDPWRHKDGKGHLTCGDAGLRVLWADVQPKWQINGHYHRHHTYSEGGLSHKILPAAPGGATLLDTSDWRFQDFTLDSLNRIADSMRKR
jgi:Icc-related predicted phosphoesterase